MPKEFDELKGQIEDLAAQGADVASSSELGEMRELISSETEAIKNQTTLLKEDAERNKAFNKLQIAADAYQYLTKERDDIAWRKEQKQVADVQKKHNRGAKDAREVMLEQNRLILEKLTQLQRAGFGGGGSGGSGGGGNGGNNGGDPNLPVPYIEGEIVETSRNIDKLGDDIRRTYRGDQLLLEGPKREFPRVMTTRNKAQYRTSLGAATLQRNLDNVPDEIKAQMMQNEKFQDDFKSMSNKMEKLIRDPKKGNRADVLKAIEKMKLSGGEDISKALGLDEVKGQVSKGEGNIFGGLARDFFGINQGTDLFSTKALKEMFSADRIFGKASKKEDTSWYNMSRYAPFQGSNQFAEGAQRDKEIEDQLGKQESKSKKKEEWRSKWIPEEYRTADAMSAADEQIQRAEQASEAAGTRGEEPLSKREKIVKERTGQDRESELEILKEIRDILKRMAQSGGFGGNNMGNQPGGTDGGSFAGGFVGDAASMAAGGYAYDKLKNAPKGRLGLLARGKALLAGGVGAVKRLGTRAAGGIAAAGTGLATRASAMGASTMAGATGLAARVGLGGAARFAGPIGAAIYAGQGLYGGYKQFNQTDEFNLMEGEDVSFGMKAASAYGGMVNALTFGLADADSVSKGVYGMTERDQLDAIQEKDPELANIIQAKIDSGMSVEDALDSERASIRDAGIDERGFFRKFNPFTPFSGTVEDMFSTSRQEAAMDSAKESGLYKKTIFGESVVDETMLGNASIEQLKAIAADDDLSDDQMQRVQKAIENRRLTMGGDQGEGFADTFTDAGSFVDTTGREGQIDPNTGEPIISAATQYDDRQDREYMQAYSEGMDSLGLQGPPPSRPEEDHAGPAGGIDDRYKERKESLAVGTKVFDTDKLVAEDREFLEGTSSSSKSKMNFSMFNVAKHSPDEYKEYQERVQKEIQEKVAERKKKHPNMNTANIMKSVRPRVERNVRDQMIKEGKLKAGILGGGAEIDGETYEGEGLAAPTMDSIVGRDIRNDEGFVKEHDQILQDTGLSDAEISQRTADSVDALDGNRGVGDISGAVSPTGTALDRMGNIFSDARDAVRGFFGMGAPTPPSVIQGPPAPAPEAKIVASINQPGVRDKSSTVARYNDRRFS